MRSLLSVVLSAAISAIITAGLLLPAVSQASPLAPGWTPVRSQPAQTTVRRIGSFGADEFGNALGIVAIEYEPATNQLLWLIVTNNNPTGSAQVAIRRPADDLIYATVIPPGRTFRLPVLGDPFARWTIEFDARGRPTNVEPQVSYPFIP